MDSGFSLHGIMLPDNCRNSTITLITKFSPMPSALAVHSGKIKSSYENL